MDGVWQVFKRYIYEVICVAYFVRISDENCNEQNRWIPKYHCRRISTTNTNGICDFYRSVSHHSFSCCKPTILRDYFPMLRVLLVCNCGQGLHVYYTATLARNQCVAENVNNMNLTCVIEMAGWFIPVIVTKLAWWISGQGIGHITLVTRF